MRKKMPIFYSAVLLTGVNLLLRLISTSFQVYLSGRIGAAGIGLLQLVLSVGTLCLTASMAGVRTATMYLTAEELGKKRPQNVIWVLSGSMTYSIVCSGVISACVFYFAPRLAVSWVGDIRSVDALRLFAMFLPVSCLCGVMTGYFTAANRIGTLAAVEVAEQVLSMAVTVVLLTAWAGTDAGRACCAVVIGSGVGACLTALSLAVLRLWERAPSGRRIPIGRRLLHSAVPLAMADNLRSGISTTENLMVPKRLALYRGIGDPLAAFGTVCGMVFPVLMFPSAILFGLAELLIPELARCAAAGSTARIRYLVRRTLRVCLLFGCLTAGLMFHLSEPLCLRLYGSYDAGHYLRRFSLLIPMLYCDALTDAMTKGLGQQRACVRYNILTSSMDVAFLFFLLPRFGMDGYYASFLVTHLINFLLSLRRLLKIVGKVVSVRTGIAVLLTTAVSIFVSALLRQPILCAVAFPLLYTAILALLQIIGADDFLWLKGLLIKK